MTPERLASMSDSELLEAYQATNGEPGDVLVEQLLAEIERRGLDI